ncbi:g-strand binding protein [Teratosphaeriaceae sp. CCFEE 6253]|nr:g-strand binding protein [Teratosphaeriaceae sp. CCFEE 6253]
MGSIWDFVPADWPARKAETQPGRSAQAETPQRRRGSVRTNVDVFTDCESRADEIPAQHSHSPSRSRSPRRRYNDEDRSRSRTRYRESRRERSPANGNGTREHGSAAASSRRHEDRGPGKEQMLSNIKESSQQDRRVYVGNLAYDVKWAHLKDFMRQDCRIVEYATRDEAQTAINTLSNQNLMGRLIYVREVSEPSPRTGHTAYVRQDREMEPRFSGSGPPAARGGFDGGYGAPRGGFGGGYGGGPMGGNMGMQGRGGGGGGTQIFINNLPLQVGWQDLKDLFRQAVAVGQILRADVHTMPDGSPKGTGIVAFDNPDDTQNAIQQFNGYDWQGHILEVREDRFAGGAGFGGGRGGFGGGFGGGFRGGPRGGFRGGFVGGGYAPRGAFGGGFGGGRGGYGGGYGGGFVGGRGGYGGGYGGGQGGGYGGMQPGGYGGAQNAPPAAAAAPPNPFVDFATAGGLESNTIFVRNLPWSTSNDDLIELFQTIGKVERAEIKMESNMRSSGTGVVEFAAQDDAATAINKFMGYQYGNRPLGLSYVRYSNQGGDMMEGAESTGNMQEQMM